MSKSNKAKCKQLENLMLMVTPGKDTIQVAALKLKDHTLLSILGGECLISKELKVHYSCRKAYIYQSCSMYAG